MAAFEVDDRQPSHAESHPVMNVSSLVIRTTVDDGPAHGIDQLGGRLKAAWSDDPANTTHGESGFLVPPRLEYLAHNVGGLVLGLMVSADAQLREQAHQHELN